MRGWGDVEIPNYQQLARARLERIKQRRPALLANRKTAMNSLAISGGAADGAFGAGFLNGWTAAGTRPKFEVVTCVSTGALIAPFAFLGSSHYR